MNFGDFKNGKAQQPLPTSLTPHESEIADFAQLCNKTCKRILNLLSLGLEVINAVFGIPISCLLQKLGHPTNHLITTH